MILGRRTLLLGCGAMMCARPPSAAPFVAPPGDALAFKVFRDGDEIGMHTLDFTQSGDDLTVRIAVDLAVGLGPIVLYRFTHRATEIWRAGRLFSVDAQTDNDGTPFMMTARRDDSGLVVEGSKAARYIAPPNALPATHWNRNMLDGPVINTQHGELMKPSVTPLGPELIACASGSEIRADHFSVTGDATLDTWYDDARSWAGLGFKAKDGSDIRYERL
jgi:hypothetical protein